MSREDDIRRQMREKGHDGFVLEEMIRLGYWPKEGDMPDDPANELRRRQELRKELRALRSESHRAGNIERQLRELKKQRLKESRERRKENKKRRLEEKKRRRKEWQEKQDKDIVYLGEEVSGCLNDNTNELNILANENLPVFEGVEEFAAAMEISVRDLRFLSFNRIVSKVSHYRRFTMKKKSGGERIISAPRGHLKKAQRWLLNNVLNQVQLHPAAQGFKPGTSIITNAEIHRDCQFLINIDLENFFPTFTFRRVKGMFKALGYSHKLSTVMALLCTEAETEEMELDGETWYVATGDRHLPQGSPASPTVTNIICRSLDKSLSKLAEKYGLKYSRYADDMSFSSIADVDKKAVGQFMRQLNFVVRKAGLKINRKKTKIIRKGGRREVTGLIVQNGKPAIGRKKLKDFKAVLFHIEKDGPEGKTWGNSDDIFAAILGYARYIHMVDKEKGMLYLDRVQKLIDKHGWKEERKSFERRELNPLLKERVIEEEPVEVTLEDLKEPKEKPAGKKNPQQAHSPDSSETPPKKKPWWKFW